MLSTLSSCFRRSRHFVVHSDALRAAFTNSPVAQISVTPSACADATTKTVPGLNIKKSGSDPELKDDSEYPEWIWELAKKDTSLYELNKQDEEDMGFPQVSIVCPLDTVYCQQSG